MPIEWRDGMAIGFKAIDDDHRQLIATINEFEGCPDFSHAEIAAKKLFKYTHEHFQREESLQALMRYPLADAHHEAHEVILNNLKDLIRTHFMAKSGERDERAAIDRLTALMREWIVEHVLKTDIRMKPYLPTKD